MTEEIPPAPIPPFRTERLILRDVAQSDYDDVHAYAIDPEVVRYMDWGPNTPEQTHEVIERWLKQQAERPPHVIMVVLELLEERRVIGSMRLEVQDLGNRTADIGYTIHRPYWGRGLTVEAARALLDIAFGQMQLHRVYANCDVRNRGSWRVMEKLGMRREGVLKKAKLRRDGWHDAFLYAVLAEEWG